MKNVETNNSFALLTARLKELGLEQSILDRRKIKGLPAGKGAYLLLLNLLSLATISTKHSNKVDFSPSWYIYAGSAYGPGGVRARLLRHCNRKKKIHWHIDQLSVVADTYAMTFFDDNECRLLRVLEKSKDFKFPLKGFGSTDCRSCASHLLRWAPMVAGAGGFEPPNAGIKSRCLRPLGYAPT